MQLIFKKHLEQKHVSLYASRCSLVHLIKKIISKLQRLKILNQTIIQDKGLSFLSFGKFISIGIEFLVSIVGLVCKK